jgi:hypothetical protein
MHLQNFENFGNEFAKIKNQFLIFRKSLCKIAGNPWKSILKSINQNAFFFSREHKSTKFNMGFRLVYEILHLDEKKIFLIFFIRGDPYQKKVKKKNFVD